MPTKSRYCLLVENLSSITRSADIKREFEYSAGKVLEVERDSKSRSALVEMKHSGDAEYAFKNLHDAKVDGKRWCVDFATKEDFKYFAWKWTEGGASPSRSPPPRD